MLALSSATIDDTVKPAIEWIHGRPVQKLMPTDLHSFVQTAFLIFFDSWAKGTERNRGKVGCEWRFRIPPNSYGTESVVPDVAFLSTYFDLEKKDRTYPAIAPDIVVEVLSPDDRLRDVREKCAFYLWWGVRLVIIADPLRRTVEAHESAEAVSHLKEYDVVRSNAFPSLTIPLHEIFAELDDPA
jgi:Uma2 family endonuclease